ncbi:hypothetical protein C9I57_28215 [Trinickia symbiotica]|uniref:Uncharacterized protein n=1 Tax=Trinickia symbiotica TaxID=863227 RepID=A0A2T3XLL2_9BURK|nr:hypothetical protein C9I57_28215 [Trinickia symbiotica]
MNNPWNFERGFQVKPFYRVAATSTRGPRKPCIWRALFDVAFDVVQPADSDIIVSAMPPP